jgi:hypothetical protein
VQDSLKQEFIVGSPDMTPALIKAEAKAAGLDLATLSLPTVNVAGKAINNGAKARVFASYMRIHALEASGGLTYSQMGRFVAKPGTPAKLTDGHGATSDEKYALVDPNTKRSIENGARNLWVTETALSTALNTSYMAESLSLFGIVVGIALLLSGIGFAILAVGGTLKRAALGRGGARLARVPHRLRAAEPPSARPFRVLCRSCNSRPGSGSKPPLTYEWLSGASGQTNRRWQADRGCRQRLASSRP